MLKKFNIESINEIHDQWCRDNGYPVRKSTSPQAKLRRKTSHKLQDPRTRVQAYKLVQGTSNKDKGIFFMLNMK